MRAYKAVDAGIEAVGDGMFDLFVPETLLPEQYFDRCSAHATETPEKRLMFAVLLDAALQLQNGDAKGAAEAEHWIRDTKDIDAPYSFRNICEALAIEPSCLAHGLLAGRNGEAPQVRLRQTRTFHTHITPLRTRCRRGSRSRFAARRGDETRTPRPGHVRVVQAAR
jgi:hypothetical protein